MNRLQALRNNGVECALYSDPKNIQYLTGYTGEGYLLVLPNAAYIVTDFRYVEQAQIQSPFCTVAQTYGKEKPDSAVIYELLTGANIKALAVETDKLTYDNYKKLENTFKGVELKKLDSVCEKMRIVKDTGELDTIAKAAKISCAAFMDMLKELKPGMTEKQACALLEYRMRINGGEGMAFDTIVAAGEHGSLPHAQPSDRVISSGELVTFDFGASLGGYCSDMTRTVAVGEISDELRNIYNAVYEAHMMALNAVKPGMRTYDIDKIARDYLDSRYPGAFGHSTGHGVGLYIHEKPNVAKTSEDVLKPGHVITIEPGVYIPGVGGCRIEDTVFVTEDGYFDPYTAPKQLLVV